jgi:hypothetical protein
MGKLDQIKAALKLNQANSKMLGYALWYIESLKAENEFLRRVADKTITGSPEKNAANQIEHERSLVDNDKSTVQVHDEVVERFRKNV